MFNVLERFDCSFRFTFLVAMVIGEDVVVLLSCEAHVWGILREAVINKIIHTPNSSWHES